MYFFCKFAAHALPKAIDLLFIFPMLNMKKITFLLLWLAAFPAMAQTISYKLSFSEPQAHYADVEIRVEGLKKEFLDLKMPVWAPGSYLVREFSKNVEGEAAKDKNGKELPFRKINKNTWRVQNGKTDHVVFSYRVYAFELSVRTSFVDAAHAYLNGTSVFVYPDGMVNLPATIKVVPAPDWKKISCGLSVSPSDPWTLLSPNYDVLADSPMEIGNQDTFEFTAAGVLHKVSIYGGGAYDKNRLMTDMAKIVEKCTEVFGENPNKEYTFLIINNSTGGGGLEHLNSTSLLVSRFAYANPNDYRGFLSLVAHEYFHLWNVKRMRPEPLGPFNYDAENYTRQLWIAEGFTDYYDNLIPYRAGFVDGSAFLGQMSGLISSHENSPGSKVQSLGESSFDAWIKGYRPNENSANTTISYYGSGARMAALLDLEIINATKGAKSLDDLMRGMYQEYFKKQNRPFTEAEFQQMAENICGKKLDEFFQEYVYGKKPVDYAKYYAYAGIGLNVQADSDVEFGANMAEEGGRFVVKNVYRNTPAYQYGLNVNDEVIGFDGMRVGRNTFDRYMSTKKSGDKISLLISRDGVLKTLEMVLSKTQDKSYFLSTQFERSAAQQVVYEKWLKR
jgi:predicted metalloprotease with PDZ domain